MAKGGTKRKRGGRDPESPPEDVARVRLTAGLRSFYDRLDAAKSTENLADDDIQELSKILHYAVCAQSKQHQASPQMLGKFVDAIFKNWWKGSGDLDPPRDVIGAPYRTSQYHFEFRDRDEADPRDKLAPGSWPAIKLYARDTSSLQYVVCGRDNVGREVTRAIARHRISYSAPSLDKLAIDVLAKPSETYNCGRAIQYARFYLQEKALRGSAMSMEYKFFQFPDFILALRSYDPLRISRWMTLRIKNSEPTLFLVLQSSSVRRPTVFE